MFQQFWQAEKVLYKNLTVSPKYLSKQAFYAKLGWFVDGQRSKWAREKAAS
jgi:hypothetical protein